MRIEHVAIWTRDIDRLAQFYARHFGAAVGSEYVNEKKQFKSRFLGFDGGARIELMKTTRLVPVEFAPGVERMGLTHLAISLGSASAVDAACEKLRAEGVPVLDGPRWTGDGYYECVVLDPDGNRLELTA
ncbi:MAG: VOC family protein [Steroidobacteraceae bacterium]